MTLEEYQAQLAALKNVPHPEYGAKASALEMEYLSQQKVPDAATAAEIIVFLNQTGRLMEIGIGIEREDWRCEALDLSDNNSPDKRIWRCTDGNNVVDVVAESEEAFFVSSRID